MNTPKEQAELYRKAADTIEMCAKYDIEPTIKHMGVFRTLISIGLNDDFCKYEFPIAVIEGELIWKDTVVYDCNGNATSIANMMEQYKPYSLKPKPLCMVEGKPVYKGDTLWNTRPGKERQFTAQSSDAQGVYDANSEGAYFGYVSWSQKPKTIMVEMLEEDAKEWAKMEKSHVARSFQNLANSCRRALNKQQGE